MKLKKFLKHYSGSVKQIYYSDLAGNDIEITKPGILKVEKFGVAEENGEPVIYITVNVEDVYAAHDVTMDEYCDAMNELQRLREICRRYNQI